MQYFINIIIKYKEYITFTALVVIALSLVSMGEVSKLGGFRTVVIGSMSSLQDAFSWIPNPAALRSENRALRELNMQLSQEVISMRKSLLENQRLRGMLDLRDKSKDALIAGEVVGKSSIQMRNYITLNKGSNSGIQAGMSARTDAGLVGVVISAASNYSLIELLNNRHVKISGKILRTQTEGIVAWEGGEFLIMQNIPQSFDVKTGDVIVTSNYSAKYPQDVPIGKIIKVEDEQGSLFHKIVVEPLAKFASLEQVFVISYVPDPEKIKLIENIEQRMILERKKGR